MKTRTSVKAGGKPTWNHNEAMVTAARRSEGLKVSTRIKAGLRAMNHNETLVSDAR